MVKTCSDFYVEEIVENTGENSEWTWFKQLKTNMKMLNITQADR